VRNRLARIAALTVTIITFALTSQTGVTGNLAGPPCPNGTNWDNGICR